MTRTTTHAPGTKQSTTKVRLVEASDIVTTVPNGTDGTPRPSWIDLRKNPDQIDLMEELRGRPTLREQVELLNAPESPLITIACAASTTRLFQEGGPPAWRTSSSVQLAFAAPDQCDLDNYAPLARALLDGIGGDPHATRWNRLVELRPEPVEFQAVGRRAWSVTIRTSAYGLEGAAAAHEWDLCVQIQTSVIALWVRLGTLDAIVDCVSTRPRTHAVEHA